MNPELKLITEIQEYTAFMRHSNKIEGELEPKGHGEGRLNPGDQDAVRMILGASHITKRLILDIHRVLGDYLQKPWVGRFRDCAVCVGSYEAPEHDRVDILMTEYLKKYSKMDSWTAYNEFELIHPFEDLNGRMGRLLWLRKALKEDYSYQRTFLEHYHYQTLRHYGEKAVDKSVAG